MKITYKQIMSFNPGSYLENIGMPEDYEAELKDFIIEYKDKGKSIQIIIWMCCRKEFFNDRDLRLFGVWCALQVKSLMQDQRSLDCLEVAEKFAFDEANQEKLSAKAAKANKAVEAAWAVEDNEAAAYSAEAAANAAARNYCAVWTAKNAVWAAEAGSNGWAVDDDEVARNYWASRAASCDAMNAQIQILLKMIEKPNGQWFKEWKEKI